MSKSSGTFKDVLKVAFSNFCIVISGGFVGFIIPKVLGVSGYGYYKTFTLYASYVGIFSFGISEGLYLKYSGCDYESLNLSKMRFFSKFFFSLQLCIGLTIVLLSLCFLKNEARFIFIAVAVYLVEMNFTAYLQYIAQMTMKFNYYSIRNVIKSILTIVAVMIILCSYYFDKEQDQRYEYFTILVIIISTILLIIYIEKFKNIIFGKIDGIQVYKKELINTLTSGFPYLLSLMCSTLLFSIDRQFVAIAFDIKTYGIYAFAYSMLSLVTVCTSAISTVIYPKLKKNTAELVFQNYPLLSAYVSSLVILALNIYFPLIWFINTFLPQYKDSLEIFRIIFPGLALSSCVNVVMQNYYKYLNKNTYFFVINLFVLILSIFTNAIALFIFNNPQAISWASIFVLIVYYFISEHYFIHNHLIKWKKNALYLLISMFLFYICTCFTNNFFHFFIYFLSSCVVTILFNKTSILNSFRTLLRSFSHT